MREQDSEAMARAKAEAMWRARQAVLAGGTNPNGSSSRADETDDDRPEKERYRGPQPITRPSAGTTRTRLTEWNVRPDADGKVSLHLRGQKWVE